MPSTARIAGLSLLLCLLPVHAQNTEPPLLGFVQQLDELHAAPEHAARVYLPPSYASSNRRYPVLYVQDAQLLFGGGPARLGAEYVAERLAREGLELIVVGVDAPARATNDAAPFLAQLVSNLKPWVDVTYRTRPGAKYTGIAGSGTGAWLSVQAGLAYPQVFGFVGALSPDAGQADRALLERAWKASAAGQAYFIGVGTREGSTEEASLTRVMDASELAWALRKNGARVGYLETAGAEANVSSWRQVLPQVMRSFQLYAKN